MSDEGRRLGVAAGSLEIEGDVAGARPPQSSLYGWFNWPWTYFFGQPRDQESDAEEFHFRELQASDREDFRDLEVSQFIQTGFRDVLGRQLVLFLGKQLPATLISKETLLRFCIAKLNNVVQEPYIIVYIHTGSSFRENSPGLRWMWATYDKLPSRYRKNLQRLYILHGDLALWASLWVICPWMCDGFWRKVEFVLRVEFLWDYVKKGTLPLPDYVMEHDEELEEHPLMDYGIVATRDAATPGMSPQF